PSSRCTATSPSARHCGTSCSRDRSRQPVTAITPEDNRIALEGHDLIIVEVGHTDTDDASVLHVSDLNLVVAGDAIYNGVQYLSESGNGGREAWRKAIDTVEALRPRWIVAGHKNKALDDDGNRTIAETRQYLDDVDELLRTNTTGLDFFRAMLDRYPNRLNPGALWVAPRPFTPDTQEAGMAKLDGKIALITGGSSGIGLATANHFVAEGAYVFITGRREAELTVAIKDIGRNVTGVQGDVASLAMPG